MVLAVRLCGFGQPLCRPAGGGGQHAFQFLGHEDFQDATDERGLADAGPARDHEHLVPARLPDRPPFGPAANATPNFALHPGDGLLHVDPGKGCGVAEAMPRTDRANPTSAQCRLSEKQPCSPSTASRTTPSARIAARTASSTIRRSTSISFVVCSTTPGSGYPTMALAGQLLERVLDGGSCPVRAVPVDAQLGGQFVCRLEADPTDVVRQLVGVRLDLGNRFMAVGAVDADGPARSDAVLGQEEHDLADFLLLLPTFPDSLESFRADALICSRASEDFSKMSRVRS